jgi:hypothetical protein
MPRVMAHGAVGGQVLYPRTKIGLLSAPLALAGPGRPVLLLAFDRKALAGWRRTGGPGSS